MTSVLHHHGRIRLHLLLIFRQDTPCCLTPSESLLHSSSRVHKKGVLFPKQNRSSTFQTLSMAFAHTLTMQGHLSSSERRYSLEGRQQPDTFIRAQISVEPVIKNTAQGNTTVNSVRNCITKMIAQK